MPANITFTYNQNDGNTNIGYGRGWRCCYSQYLELVRLAGIYYYKWIDGDGTRIYFTARQGDVAFVLPDPAQRNP